MIIRKFKFLVKIFFCLFIVISFSEANCNWCMLDDSGIEKIVNSFLKLSPKEQIDFLEKNEIKVVVLNSGRKTNSSFFNWQKIKKDQALMKEISKDPNVLGKTLCKDERPFATKKLNVFISGDAPISTLLHEYLHALQIQKDFNWCKTSKDLWTNLNPTKEEIELVRNHEWDVRKILWNFRTHSSFNTEDRIVIAEGLMRESKLRELFDAEAIKFIKNEQVEDYLNKQIIDYKTQIRVK